MTTAQVVKTSVTVTNSSFQTYTHPDYHTRQLLIFVSSNHHYSNESCCFSKVFIIMPFWFEICRVLPPVMEVDKNFMGYM